MNTTERNTPPPRKIYTMSELLDMTDWRRHSELCSKIHDLQTRLLESEPVNSAIDSNEALGFTLDTVDFTEDEIEVSDSEIRVEFQFTLTGEAHNHFASTSHDVTIDGTATAVIDAAGSVSFEDVAIDDSDFGEEDFSSEDTDEDSSC